MSVRTSQTLPRADDGRFPLVGASKAIVNCKVNGVGGLRKC